MHTAPSSARCYLNMASQTLHLESGAEGSGRSESPSHQPEEIDDHSVESKSVSLHENGSENGNQMSRRERKRVCFKWCAHQLEDSVQ